MAKITNARRVTAEKRSASKRRHTVTLSVEPELLASIKQQVEAEAFDISVAAWIRAAIREYLKARDTKEAA